MADTKENILMTALRLFAADGYEAVSVCKIAGELGMTKGALYKHYKNKRDIFDSILERICQLDTERAKEAKVPEKNFDENPLPFYNTSVEGIRSYMISQFLYWTEDEIACNFRRMLTIEQYRTPEMTALYQKVLASGPFRYMEDLFREMAEQGVLHKSSPKQMAVELYAPFYLLLSISDAASCKEEKKEAADLYMAYMERFIEKYAVKNTPEYQKERNPQVKEPNYKESSDSSKK